MWPAGSLVFTAPPMIRTLETLLRLGFKHAALAPRRSGLHFGRPVPPCAALAAARSLTELMPLLLEAFARSGDPDAALAGFDFPLAGMPRQPDFFWC